MTQWRVFYFRPHRKTGEGERRDQAVVTSESEPTVEQVAEATGDAVLRLDGVEQLPEVEAEVVPDDEADEPAFEDDVPEVS